MDILKELGHIKKLYSQGENIINYLKANLESQSIPSEAVLISYDLQAGTYIQHLEKNKAQKDIYTQAIAQIIQQLGAFNSILEVGVGEATTFVNVLKKLPQVPKVCLGFDISWSRIKYAQEYIQSQNQEGISLFTGDLFHTPIQTNSIDIVYTSHSIEPNGGREKEALEELYRITNKYLILLEPAYELANEEAKARMDRLGYVKGLKETAQSLGYEIVDHRLFDVINTPLNPTGLLIIKKNEQIAEIENPLACPITKAPLEYIDDSLFCKESLLAYPQLSGIPCLLPQNAIVATHFIN